MCRSTASEAALTSKFARSRPGGASHIWPFVTCYCLVCLRVCAYHHSQCRRRQIRHRWQSFPTIQPRPLQAQLHRRIHRRQRGAFASESCWAECDVCCACCTCAYYCKQQMNKGNRLARKSNPFLNRWSRPHAQWAGRAHAHKSFEPRCSTDHTGAQTVIVLSPCVLHFAEIGSSCLTCVVIERQVPSARPQVCSRDSVELLLEFLEHLQRQCA